MSTEQFIRNGTTALRTFHTN